MWDSVLPTVTALAGMARGAKGSPSEWVSKSR
jgi:hypothetical protein